jgi:hypothetical protein
VPLEAAVNRALVAVPHHVLDTLLATAVTAQFGDDGEGNHRPMPAQRIA